jgi:hypothetical protein
VSNRTVGGRTVGGRAAILAAAVLALVCAGCRSDGGLDRSDGPMGWKFSTSRIANHTRDDVANTTRTIQSAPGALQRSIDASRKNLTDSYHLYFENGQSR